MDATANLQLNVTMHNFKEMKCKYMKLEEDHKDLELLYEKQKERFKEVENRRNQLIKLLREKVDKVETYKVEIESLQKENSNLNAAIQDQNLLINEYSTTIEQLKKENALLKTKRNEPNNIIDKGIKKPNQAIHLNGNHFSHPSFDTPATEVKKQKKKKSPLSLQNRYSNLDISVNGVEKKEESINNKNASAKKRRLFSSLEDDMIDLTIENND